MRLIVTVRDNLLSFTVEEGREQGSGGGRDSPLKDNPLCIFPTLIPDLGSDLGSGLESDLGVSESCEGERERGEEAVLEMEV